jgi:hypothetical protein
VIPEVFTLAQVVGYIAFAVSLASFQFKRQRALFGINMASDAAWVAHYLLLGGIAPAISIGVSFFRTLLAVFVLPQHKGLVSGAAFAVITGLILALNDAGAVGYLPIAAALAFSLAAFFNESYAISRIMISAGMLVWIAIGVAYGSIGEVISSSFAVLSLGIGAWRHAKKPSSMTA